MCMHGQVLVDISTQTETFERVDAAVTVHLSANPGEFTGKHLVVANFATDPLKFTLCVWWEYSHTGKCPAQLSNKFQKANCNSLSLLLLSFSLSPSICMRGL